MKHKRAKRNKTIKVEKEEEDYLKNKVFFPSPKKELKLKEIQNKTICSNLFDVIDYLPKEFADLIIIDPPYNLTKNFNGFVFKASNEKEYIEYLESWLYKVVDLLKPNGSLYLCGDWKNTASLQYVLSKKMTIINRITWQREKGRGSKNNWKNSMEDIWFAVKNPKDYYFNVDRVMMKKKVIAPYKENGKPKDWEQEKEGKFRMTYPSNFWNDISVPFWSMSENTNHPTQKPEKLIAKLILASSPEEAIVFDPFLGSGTTSVTAKKLNRHYVGIEQNLEYCLWTEKRLEMVNQQKEIQGYENGVFKERNC